MNRPPPTGGARIGEEILSMAKKPKPSGRPRTPAASVDEYLAALPKDLRAVGCSWAAPSRSS
jgi:hypothetical protein